MSKIQLSPEQFHAIDEYVGDCETIELEESLSGNIKFTLIEGEQKRIYFVDEEGDIL